MRRYRWSLVGLTLFLVAAVVTTWMVFGTLRRTVSGSTNTYSATFTDVSGLHAGDDVRVAGVRVGRVEGVALDGTLAKVTFQVQKSQVLYHNSVAAVTYQNLIGQRYLGLAPGAVGDQSPLPDRGEIPLDHTMPSFDISNLLNGFEPLFSLLDPQQVDNFSNGLIEALQGDSGSVLTLLTQTSALAESFAGPDEVLDDLINNLNKVATNLADHNADLQTVIGQTREVMGTLGARRNELVASASSINKSVVRLAAITDAINPDLQEFVNRQPGFVKQLTGDGRDRFAYLVQNIPIALKGLARATEDGAYATGYICDVNSSLFNFLTRLIPSIIRHATPGGVIKHSPICR